MSHIAWALLAYIVVQRLAELAYARRNTQRLLAAGAYEVGAAHYPFIVALHAGWIAALAAWLAWEPRAVAWSWAAVFVLAQAGRVWVIASLGRYWTTRVIVVPDAPLVARGPYRFVRHPNYVVVAVELFAVPMMMGAIAIAIAFTLLNAAMMVVRIRAENRALATRAGLSSAAAPTATSPPASRSATTRR
ncbi:MAG: isoprenylcysteine carboxylmethyltransferase family protein [Rhodospirillaceae bacterium]|nr:isoprenylcysteine carboxylmethyltransferase family protein [Rhodospirillaceae bacterium]